tara:strand:+ start:116 stop:523 length:408 start_codon:yes stop_codon:yes gene_type:complete
MKDLKLQTFKKSMENNDLQANVLTLQAFEALQKTQEYQPLMETLMGVVRDVITAKHPEILEIRANLMVAKQEFKALCEQERKALKLHHNLVATENGSPAERAASWNHWCFQRSISRSAIKLESLRNNFFEEIKNV